VDAELLYDVDGLDRFDMTVSAVRSVIDQLGLSLASLRLQKGQCGEGNQMVTDAST
jgi:hypothetical protein